MIVLTKENIVNNEEVKESKFKKHLKKHKVKYYVAGGVVVGFGAGVLGHHLYTNRKFDKLSNKLDELAKSITALAEKVQMNEVKNSIETVTNGDNSQMDLTMIGVQNVTNNFGGRMSKIVRRLSDGELFESIREAAESAGVSRERMADNLYNRIDDIDGEKYEFAGYGITRKAKEIVEDVIEEGEGTY